MKHTHEMICPECGGEDEIDVAALIWTRLTADGAAVDQSHDGSQDWDYTSAARCNACGHLGKVAEFMAAYEESLGEDSCESCGATGSDAMNPAYFGDDDERLCVDCGMDYQDCK